MITLRRTLPACMCHKRDASILTALRPIPLLVLHYDRDVFAPLRYAPAMSFGDHNGAVFIYSGYHRDLHLRQG